jgi:hypothetical protein
LRQRYRSLRAERSFPIREGILCPVPHRAASGHQPDRDALYDIAASLFLARSGERRGVLDAGFSKQPQNRPQIVQRLLHNLHR